MTILYTDQGQRQQVLASVRKVIIKVGTRLLTGIDGASKQERVEQLVAQIAALRQRGLEVILVSSGAIGAGMRVLNTAKRPTALPLLQAHAAVGQSRLMYLYETACAKHGFHCGQLLLTAADVQDRERHLNVMHCLDALLREGVLPVINENDSVSVEEIRFGDNDNLAALVATMVRADLTVLLTSINGMHERHADGSFGRRLAVVSEMSDALKAMAGGTDDQCFSVGGMATKLAAAELVSVAGEPLIIANGQDFAILEQIVTGMDVGTLFLPAATTRMKAHKRYLAFFSEPTGSVIVDTGAEQALCQQGRSLLASGITAVHGVFARGDTLQVVNAAGKELARGVSNYNRHDLERILGCRSEQVRELLGTCAYDEVIHRNSLVLTQR